MFICHVADGRLIFPFNLTLVLLQGAMVARCTRCRTGVLPPSVMRRRVQVAACPCRRPRRRPATISQERPPTPHWAGMERTRQILPV